MKTAYALIPLFLIPVACGSAPAAEPVTPEPEPTLAEPAPEPAEAPAPAEPTAEEKAKAAAAEKLAKDFAEMEAESETENKRWTEELHKKSKQLAEARYPNAKVALAKLLKAEHRVPGHADRDKFRHPAETLAFFGVKPEMTVLEYGPGEGWYTELLAPMLASRGKLIVTSGDPKGSREVRPTLYAQRLERFLSKAPELYGKVEKAVVDGKKPELGLDATLDMALVIRGMHGWQRDGITKEWLAQILKALKPGGVLGIVQHRAKPDADPNVSAKQGYLPEKWLIAEVEAAGFKFSKKSEINANAKDTADHPEGVWTLPPTLRLKDKDREKYVEIGESDRMTLRFVKPAK